MFHKTISSLFTPGHFIAYSVIGWLFLKRPGVNSLRSAFKTDLNPITQTTSKHIWLLKATYVNFTPPKNSLKINKCVRACYIIPAPWPLYCKMQCHRYGPPQMSSWVLI